MVILSFLVIMVQSTVINFIGTSFISDYEEFLYADFRADYEVVYRLERTYGLLKKLLKQKRRHHFRR